MPPKVFVTMLPGAGKSYEDAQAEILRCDDVTGNPKHQPLDEVDSGGKPVAVIMCGPPASGKSTWRRSSPAKQRMKSIDPDDIKKEIHEGKLKPMGSDGQPLAGRWKLKAETPGDLKINNEIHKHSMRVTKLRYTLALKKGESVLFDTVGAWKPFVEKVVLKAKNAGHHVHMALAYTDRNTCLASNLARERTVPQKVLTERHEGLTKNWSSYVEMDEVDTVDKKVR